MTSGAVEFLTKPFREQELLDAVRRTIDSDRVARLRRAKLADLRRRYESLTSREHEVMGRVVRGMLNKQMAGEIGTAAKNSEGAPRPHPTENVCEVFGRTRADESEAARISWVLFRSVKPGRRRF